jgi:hypothetical protein
MRKPTEQTAAACSPFCSPFDRGYVSVLANEKPARAYRYREAPAHGILLPGSRTSDKPGRLAQKRG